MRLLLLALASVLMLLPAFTFADDAKELKVIAKAKEVTQENSIGPIVINKQAPALIRSAEELVAASKKAKSAKDPEVQKEMTTALAKLLKVEGIDWSKQMVLVGVVESFDSLKPDGKVLTATYTRYYERPAPAVLPSPKVAVLTERFEGEVKFVPKPKDDKEE